MNRHEFLHLVRSDLARYTTDLSLKGFLRSVALVPGFKFTFFVRALGYVETKPSLLKYPAWVPLRLLTRHYTFKYGFDIPYNTHIGAGLYLGHFGTVVIHHEAVIGRNCNLSHDVTLGSMPRGPNRGTPVLGDRVYVGPGARLVGNVRVGNDVAIGANCVVTKDVPDNAVVVGVPGRVISYEGSAGLLGSTLDDGLMP